MGGRRETEPPVQVEAGASGRSHLGEEVWVVTIDREASKGKHPTAQQRRIQPELETNTCAITSIPVFVYNSRLDLLMNLDL